MSHETPHPPDPPPSHATPERPGDAAAEGCARTTEEVAFDLIQGVHIQIVDLLRDPNLATNEAWARAGELLADESIHACAEVLKARAQRHQMAALRPLIDGMDLQAMTRRVFGLPA